MTNFSHIAHDDHGLTPGHVDLLQTEPGIASLPDGSFVLVVVPLPAHLDPLPCALYGPAAGDGPVANQGVTLETRGNRAGPSRLIDRPHRPARNMVVIGIRGGVCFTAYGSRAPAPSPMEPWDAERKNAQGKVSAEEVDHARAFWSVHALAR